MAEVEVAVGRIAKAHGVRGEVAVDVLTDEPERRFTPGTTYAARRTRGADQPLTLTDCRWHQGRLLARFEEIPDRTMAEGARGLMLMVRLTYADTADDGSYYDHQLVGLVVVDTDGLQRGEVIDVLHHTGQDLLVIRTQHGGQAEVLVPFVEALVPVVDLEAGRVVVADRPGLLRPEEAE